ncbi:MAG: T9SS type A sorting domain-containing protein [Flavobacteriales bacterium]|nr:T9SS type A sorting domain-containing protein [Flavobacteriales bacterium]
MKNLLLILFLNFTYNCLAQTVLNGSFEDNSLDNNFHYGLGTESFANNVNHAFAFCEDDTLTLAMNKKSAKDGDWSIILYENLGGDGLNYSKNFISMKLSENLEVGKNYSISFYTKKYELNEIPYTSTLSSNMANGLEFGYSEDSSQVGVFVFNSSTPLSFDNWEYQYKEFKCYHDNINYLTFRLKEAIICGPRFICQLDHIVLSTLIGVNDSEHTSSLYPNPTEGRVQLQHPTATQIVLHDLMGKEQHRQAVLPQHNNSLDLEHLPRGIYLLSYWHQGQQLYHEKLLKKSKR